MNLFNSDFREYIDLLNRHEVEYMLVGGLAVNLHGYRRSTGDMDLFVNPTAENHVRLKKVHHDFGMPMGDMERVDNFMNISLFDVYTFGISPVQIDIMTACKGIVFSEAYEHAVLFEIYNDTCCKVIDYRELIAAKKAAGRYRDRADIEELKKIRNKHSKKDR